MESIEADVNQVGRFPLDRRQRWLASALALVLLGLLAVSRTLEPSPAGMGTHQQLGLPPCKAVMLLGIPCPTCGMTTSWSYFMRGQFIASWGANPGGFCLAVLSLATGVWAVALAVRGIYFRLVPLQIGWAIVIAITAVTLVDWAVRVF